MKVIMMIDNLDLEQGGGVGSFVYDLCCALKEKNIDLSLVSIVKNSNEADRMKVDLENRGISVQCAGANSRKDSLVHIGRYIKVVRKIIKDIASNEETICNLHLKLAVLYGTVATKGMRNVKCVETYHSQYSHYWFQNKVLSGRISMYIGCSDSARDEMRERFSPKVDKLISIPNGVRCAYLKEAATHGESRPKHDLQIVSVGRFTDQKNFHITAKAFSKLEGDVCYRIIGQGEKESEIKATCKGSCVVEFAGTVPRNDVLAEVQQADIVAMPSLWEGLSIFMLETIALGTPLMLSDIPSFRNVFKESELGANEKWRACSWGFLVQTSNPAAYREAVEYYMAHPELKRQMKKSISDYAAEYDMDSCAEKYIDTYRKVLAD